MSEPFQFEHAPPAVTRYFEAKGVKPSFDWRDFSTDEHAHSFTVAKSAGFDVAKDIRDAIAKAIRDGQDFKDFQKALEPTLKDKGWWGKKLVKDPMTGEMVEAQLGSARRLRTIYWANVRSAYAAGAWERAQATKRVLPYLEYVISTALHKREEHLSWVGTILPVDDDWWATHYPPNGWNCQCRVRQISEWEAESRGYDPETAERPEDYGSEDWINKRTGEVTRVPGGLDPGWVGNPGATRIRNATDLLVGKIDGMPPPARAAASADLAGSWLVQRIARGDISYDPLSSDPAMLARGQIGAPIAVLPDAAAEALGATQRTMTLTVADADRLRRANPDLTPSDIERVQTILDQARPMRTAAGVVLRADVGGQGWTLVLGAADETGAPRIEYLGPE